MDSTNTTGGNGEAVATSVGLAGGDLQRQITNLPCGLPRALQGYPGKQVWYIQGHRDARHAAAEVAVAADARVRQLEDMCREMLAALQGVVRVADRATDEFDAARAAIAKALGTEPANKNVSE